MRYKGGDSVMCTTCGGVVDHNTIRRSRLKTELPRLIVASIWLAHRQGDFTRGELAKHLSMTNSPHFRAALDDLVNRNILTVEVGVHPQNNRATLFYRRPGKWQRAEISRPYWQAGASR